MKRIKTYIRNRMNDERLTDLGLSTVHYGNVSVSPEQVLDVMASIPRFSCCFWYHAIKPVSNVNFFKLIKITFLVNPKELSVLVTT